jgi:hypothetical protein
MGFHGAAKIHAKVFVHSAKTESNTPLNLGETPSNGTMRHIAKRRIIQSFPRGVPAITDSQSVGPRLIRIIFLGLYDGRLFPKFFGASKDRHCNAL